MHTDVTSLDAPDDVIFITFIVELHHLLVKIKSRLRVVVHVEIDLVAYRSGNIHLYFFIEIEHGIRAHPFRQGRIIQFVGFYSENQFC
ncbi:hypothetical protein SDC9_127670 [bioreactor metagenome]|uniref:Uncharacterized protein n=1 Tax=bioreactor metagenome TaxID=1076179 RepID=A0A645CU26_9ZZZZ